MRLLLLMVFLAASSPALGRWVGVEEERIPVARLIENLEKIAKDNPTSVEVLLKRWNDGLALLPDDSLGLLAFEKPGAESTCADAGTAKPASSSTLQTAIQRVPLMTVPPRFER